MARQRLRTVNRRGTGRKILKRTKEREKHPSFSKNTMRREVAVGLGY